MAHGEKRKLSGKSYTTQTGKQSLMEAEEGRRTSEVGGGGAVWQSHRSTGWAGRRKVLWSPLLLVLLYSCAGLRLTPPFRPPPLTPPPSPCASSSQVELLGSDMLQLLPQHAEGGPHNGVQGPALLHQVVHHGRAAVGGVHLVALLHPGHHLFQRLRHKRQNSSVSPSQQMS